MLERMSRVVVAAGAVRGIAGRRSRADDAPGRRLDGISQPLLDHAGSLGRPGRPRAAPRCECRPQALSDERGRLSWRYTSYSGPLEKAALTRADPQLGRLLFSGLWFWLRPLSFGLLFLLRGLTELIGHPGAAIIALAVSSIFLRR